MIGAVEPHLRSPAIGTVDLREPASAATVAADRHRLRMLAVLVAPVAGAQGGRPIGQPLDVWGEWERLRTAIGIRDTFDSGGVPWAVARLTPPTPEALGDILAASGAGFQVVHFGCHGHEQGLHLEDRLGREQELPTMRLVDALRERAVQLVVLNACETAAVAQAIVEQALVPAVVATREPLLDREAQILAERLYRGLAIGRPIGEALRAAQESMVERHRNGDLGIPSCSAELAARRANNLFLVGDPGVTLAADEPAAQGPLFVFDQTPRNDPIRLDLVANFVGRHTELLRIARWLIDDTGRLAFVISGVGGLGKTALALNAALRSAHRFDVLAVASARDTPDLSAARVLDAIAGAQDSPPSPQEVNDPASAVARRMSVSRILLLLDNLETLDVAQTSDLARTLSGVRPESGSRVILTLRPREQGELTRLAGHGNRIELTTLDRPNALRMAWNQARRHALDPKVVPPAPTDAPEGEVEGLIRAARDAWLEGLERAWLHALDDLAARSFRHPKMIELAVSLAAERGWTAARLRLTQLAGREVTGAFNELIGTLVDDLARSNRVALNILHAVLVFRGGATTTQLRYVVLGHHVAEGSMEAIDFEDGPLATAERSSLLSRIEVDECGLVRFDLDPPIRAYLERFRPPEAERLEALKLRHAEALVSIVGEIAEALQRGEVSLAGIPEWTNLTAAWDWLAVEPTGPRGDCLLAYSRHWLNLVLRPGLTTSLEWLKAALVAARSNGSPLDEARALLGLAKLREFRRETETALQLYEKALEVYRRCGHKRGEAEARCGLAEISIASAEHRDRALDHCLQALELCRSLEDKLGIANCLLTLGMLLQRSDDLEGSLDALQEALDLYRQIDRLGEANALVAIALVGLLRDEQQEAKQLMAEAASIYAEIGDHYSLAAQTGNFGLVLLRTEKPAEARPYLSKAADLFERMGASMVQYRQRYRAAVQKIDELLSS